MSVIFITQQEIPNGEIMSVYKKSYGLNVMSVSQTQCMVCECPCAVVSLLLLLQTSKMFHNSASCGGRILSDNTKNVHLILEGLISFFV